MALTENNYVGNGSTVLYSFTFPYLATTDIKVSLDGVLTTSYTLANATTVQFTSAPSNGTKIRIYRETADTSLSSTFYPGSSIRSQDLNNNFTQNLYVTQESRNTAASATTVANTALTNSAAAVTTANTASTNASAAVSTANTASTNATSAVNTANTASSTASSAVSTANTASINATTAVSTANTALSTANTALSTANTASSNASAAVSTANTASSNATSAVNTANTANTNASNAVSTANSAVTTANGAVTTANSATTTANTANNKADQAIAAVSNSINYQLKANVAAIPASPANDTYIEVQDSTGLESFTPLAGKPAGFVGDSGLSVRLRYTSAGTTWNWLNYYANNSDSRYLKLAGGTLIGQITLAGAPTSGLHPATKTYVDGYVSALQGDIGTVSTAAAAAQSTANAALPKAGGTMTGAITLAADPSANLHPATKQYVDTADALKAPLASPTFTGTVTIPAGASISGYLTSSTAASTYQTQAGMSSYLTTSAAGITYAPLASPTFTGTVTIPAGASISGYLTTSSASSTYAPLASPTFTGTVTVPAGASISGYAALATAQSFTKAQRGTPVALTDAATVATDLSLGNHYTLTLGGNRTLGAPTNQTAGQSGVIVITQDGTGSRTLAYNSVWKFPSGTAPTLTTTANAVDVLCYYVESGTRITARLLSDVK